MKDKTGDEILRDVLSSALKHRGEALAPVSVPCPKCGHELQALCLAKVGTDLLDALFPEIFPELALGT